MWMDALRSAPALAFSSRRLHLYMCLCGSALQAKSSQQVAARAGRNLFVLDLTA